MKPRISAAFLVSVCLLSSCFGEPNEVFQQETIAGKELFSEVVAKVDTSSKRVTVSVGDFVSSAAKLGEQSTYNDSRNVKDDLGVTHTYENRYTYLTVLLSESDGAAIFDAMEPLMKKHYPEHQITALSVCQLFRYYDGKLRSEATGKPKDFYLCAFVEGEGLYNGNGLGELEPMNQRA